MPFRRRTPVRRLRFRLDPPHVVGVHAFGGVAADDVLDALAQIPVPHGGPPNVKARRLALRRLLVRRRLAHIVPFPLDLNDGE